MRNKIVTLAIAAGLLAGTSALAFAQYQPYYPYQPYYYGQMGYGYGQQSYYDLRGQPVAGGGYYQPGYSGGSMPPYGFYQPGYGGDTYTYAPPPPPPTYDLGRLPYYYGSNFYIPGWGYSSPAP